MSRPNDAPGSTAPAADADVPAAAQVVVVDDQAANVELLARILRATDGAQVHGVTDPHQAVQRCREVDADLLLLDLHMPGKDGLEVLADLRANLDDRAFLPVIVITADISPETRRRVLAAGAQDFLTKPFDNVEVELRVRNTLRTVRLHAKLERERHSLEGHVAERTRELQRANEQLLAVDQMKQDFIAMVSHEMRTPLTVIKGFPQVVTRLWDRLDETRRTEQVEALKRNTARLERLVDNLLQAGVLGAGAGVAGKPDDATPVHLRRLLDDVARDSDLEPGSVVVDCDPELSGHADRMVLESVLAHLLSNARTYGDPPIHVTATIDRAVLEVAVRDHGGGVPSEFADRAFDQFAQASVGDRRTATGAGLGLWIARKLAESRNGELVYEPADPGARFRLRLPLHP